MTSYNTDGKVGEWAREKLDILGRYLSAYTTILRKYKFEDYYYVDAFAGEGKSELRGVKDAEGGGSLLSGNAAFRTAHSDEVEYLDGSALVALGIKHPFKKYIFIERNPQRLQRLQEIASASPLGDRVELLRGDANVELINRLLKSGIDWRRNRGIVFLDPFGLQVPWATLESLARTEALEVIINFPVGMALQRLLPRSGAFSDEQRRKLTEYFGSPDWEGLLYEDSEDFFGETTRTKVADSGDRLAKWYRGQLKNLFGYATMPRLITNKQGGHLYYLIHAGPNATGVKIADDVLMKSGKLIR